MLNIEVIRFEAQDVITASVAAVEPEEACTHWVSNFSWNSGTFSGNCDYCNEPLSTTELENGAPKWN